MAGFSNRTKQYSRKGTVVNVQRMLCPRLMDFPVRIEDSVLVGNSNGRSLLEMEFMGSSIQFIICKFFQPQGWKLVCTNSPVQL